MEISNKYLNTLENIEVFTLDNANSKPTLIVKSSNVENISLVLRVTAELNFDFDLITNVNGAFDSIEDVYELSEAINTMKLVIEHFEIYVEELFEILNK